MEDTQVTTSGRAAAPIALIIGIVLAIAAILGWYRYFDESDQRAQLEKTVQDLERDLGALRTDLARERQNREQTENSLAAESEALQQLRRSLAAEQESVEQLQASLRQSRQERQQLESELQLEMSRLANQSDERQQRLQEEVSRLAADSAELENELRERQAQQASLSEQVDTANSDRAELSARLEQAHQRRQELLEQISGVRDDVAAKESALAAAKRDMQQLNSQLEQARQEKQELEARVAQLDEQQRQETAHFEALRRQLEQDLNESRVEITQLKNRMTVINLTSEVLFNSGSAKIKPAGRKVLDLIASSLNAYPDRAISIEGHTDNVPIGKNLPFVSNWDLSVTRALSAVDYLQSRDRIAPERLRAVGYGEYRPVASNDTTDGRQRNRRIEIRLLPQTMIDG
jgi:chemotaxis protein MotB